MRYEVQYLPARMVRKIAEGGEYQNESRMLTDAFVRRLVRAPGHDKLEIGVKGFTMADNNYRMLLLHGAPYGEIL